MSKNSIPGVKYDNFTSFLIAALIYFFAVFLLLFQISKLVMEAPKYTDDKNAFMDVMAIDIDDELELTRVSEELNDNKEQKEEIKENKPQPKPEPKVETIPEKFIDLNKTVEVKKQEVKVAEQPKPEPKKPVETKKELNLNDLFADTTQDNKNLTKATKDDKSVKGEAKKTGSKQSTGKIADKDSGKSQRTGVYNEFIGGVEKILTQVWSTYRAIANQDATMEIVIDANGRAKCEIIELAYDTAFNQKFRDFISRIEGMQFPKPPDGRSYTHRYKMADLMQ